jgi:hypothetical protein
LLLEQESSKLPAWYVWPDLPNVMGYPGMLDLGRKICEGTPAGICSTKVSDSSSLVAPASVGCWARQLEYFDLSCVRECLSWPRRFFICDTPLGRYSRQCFPLLGSNKPIWADMLRVLDKYKFYIWSNLIVTYLGVNSALSSSSKTFLISAMEISVNSHRRASFLFRDAVQGNGGRPPKLVGGIDAMASFRNQCSFAYRKLLTRLQTCYARQNWMHPNSSNW